MTLCRLIAPQWLMDSNTSKSRVIEGLFSSEQILDYNSDGYNIYTLPNRPKHYVPGVTLDGSQIDDFKWVFVDFDLKEKKYPSKQAFLDRVAQFPLTPSRIVDSGNGIHVYWQVSDLDSMSYLRLQRRLMRFLNTDEAVTQIFQLMRLPETLNTKSENNFLMCETLSETETVYTCEDLDRNLPAISLEDERFCIDHYNRTHRIDQGIDKISDKLPAKFGELLSKNAEVKELWVGTASDRSKNDFRLGHILFGNGFSKEDAASVLINSAKALERAPTHRYNYAMNIVDKIWTYENKETAEAKQELSETIFDILSRPGADIKGTRFPCHSRIDNTEHGFRLGQVLGIVAGSGVGKTAFTLNMFRWFSQANPDYHHFFVPLEQPANEIADRWQTMCEGDTSQHEKIHVISNYDNDGNFRHLSLDDIRTYIEDWRKRTGNKVGCVVIDHIGALKKKGAKDEGQDLMTICHSMKAFAVQLNCLLVMQSQTSREKAGIGDLELNKDAAYGTMFFEAYCDYLLTLWQPLKRCHHEVNCPTVTAFKYCKIRHKKAKKDLIQEDVAYYMYFDSNKEQLRDMTQDEKVAFNYFLPKATNLRKQDRKTDIVSYTSVPYKPEDTEVVNGKPEVKRTENRTRH